MRFPFKGKTEEESYQIILKDWSYSKPLLLKPKEGFQRLTESKISEIRGMQNARLEPLADGRILSLTKEATDILFENGYVLDLSYIERK